MWWRNMSWWRRPTACGHTLLVIHLANQNMLFGMNLQNPSRTVTHSLSSLFSLQQYNYTHCRPQEHSLCRKGNSTIPCCFPCCTCDNGMEKYWHSWRQRSSPNTFVRWCYMLAQVLLSGSGAKEEKDSGSELHGAGWDLGHSQDFLMGCGCSDSRCKNLYPAATKLNRQKQTTEPQIE